MAAGGEERAVFRALKNDAAKTLPKIAEKHAVVVEDAAEKGARSIAAHAATDAKLARDLKPMAPVDVPVAGPRLAAAGTGRPVEAAKFGRNAMRDGSSYQQELEAELRRRGLDPARHEALRLTTTNNLTEDQIREVVEVRATMQLPEGRVVSKVIKPELAERYLTNAPADQYFHPGKFGGSIARGSDTAALTHPGELRDALALDDFGEGWSPIPEGATKAFQLRFPAPHGMEAPMTFGAVEDKALADRVAAMGGQAEGQNWKAPFLGTGYTGGGVPEWSARPTELPHNAEIWKVTARGTETPLGFYDAHAGQWKPYVKSGKTAKE